MKRISFLAMYVAHLHKERPELKDWQYAVQVNKDLEGIVDIVKNAKDDTIENMVKKIEKDLSNDLKETRG